MLNRPKAFEPGNLTLWTDEYIALNVLKKHLDGNVNSGSRKGSIIKKTAKWIKDIQPDSYKILDVGCGPGLYAPLFCNLGYSYEGFDISGYQIKYAMEHNYIPLKTHYSIADFRTWKPVNTYDTVVILYGLYSFYNREERVDFLKKIRNNLNEKGCIIIEVFTEMHYLGRKETFDWKYIKKDGFWSKTPYLELNSFQRFSDRLILIRAAVVDYEIRVWNSWIQIFDEKMIRQELMEAGYNYFEVYGSCDGEAYTSDSETLCICAFI